MVPFVSNFRAVIIGIFFNISTKISFALAVLLLANILLTEIHRAIDYKSCFCVIALMLLKFKVPMLC